MASVQWLFPRHSRHLSCLRDDPGHRQTGRAGLGVSPATESTTPSSECSSNEVLSDIEMNDIASVAISPQILQEQQLRDLSIAGWLLGSRSSFSGVSNICRTPKRIALWQETTFPPNTTRLQTNRICETIRHSRHAFRQELSSLTLSPPSWPLTTAVSPAKRHERNRHGPAPWVKTAAVNMYVDVPLRSFE